MTRHPAQVDNQTNSNSKHNAHTLVHPCKSLKKTHKPSEIHLCQTEAKAVQCEKCSSCICLTLECEGRSVYDFATAPLSRLASVFTPNPSEK